MFFAIPDTIYIPMGYVYAVAGIIAAVVLFASMKGKKKTAAPAAEAVEEAPVAAPAAPAANAPLAPGSAGQLKLYDTPPKTAAMVMAIVADKLGKPINELRFVSIKEVK